MKVKVKSLKRAMVVEVPEKAPSKRRYSEQDLAPRVKRPPNKQFKEMVELSKEIYPPTPDKENVVCRPWESRKIENYLGEIKQIIQKLEELVYNPADHVFDKLAEESELGQFQRKPQVTSEDILKEGPQNVLFPVFGKDSSYGSEYKIIQLKKGRK